MAGDWLKVEHSTPEKPEMFAIAARLNIDPDHAFGVCFRMWRWFDQHTENGNAASVTKSLLDRHLGVTGFSDACVSVGWLLVTDNGLTLPNFERHNGQTSKARALTYSRVQAHRGKMKRDCNAPSVTESLPEKRTETENREEKSLGEVSPKTPLRARSRTPKAAATNYPAAFGVFWEAFPPGRRTDKPRAAESWQRAVQMITSRDGIGETAAEQWIAQRAADYAASDQGRGAYVRMPSTWLNQQGYDDPPEAWADKNGKPVVKIESPAERESRMMREYEEAYGKESE